MLLIKLPIEILISIIQLLDIKEKNCMMETCTHLCDLLLYNPICWNHLDFRPYYSISDDKLLFFINNRLLRRLDYPRNDTIKISSVSFLDLSGCYNLSNEFTCWVVSIFTGLRVLKLNRLSAPEMIKNRDSEGFDSLKLEEHYIPDTTKPETLSFLVKDSTVDTAAKLILFQNELTELKNQFSKAVSLSFLLRRSTTHSHRSRNVQYFIYRELGVALDDSNQLRTLCLSHHTIYYENCVSFLYQLKSLTYLDISFCLIESRVLTALIKSVIPQLKVLKLMAIDITESQVKLIKEQGTNIECLHLSCQKNAIPAIVETVTELEMLTDFKLYSQMDSSFDGIISTWNSLKIKKLVLSGEITTTCIVNYSEIKEVSHRFRQINVPLQQQTYITMSKDAIQKLSYYTQLTELRLGCISLAEGSLSTLYKSLCSLEIFELRYCQPSNSLLVGVDQLTKLKELHLYSIYLNQYSIGYINRLKSLKYLTISNGGFILNQVQQ